MRYLVAISVLFLTSLTVGQQAATAGMTHEEQTVRTAYAKLSYAVDLETATRAVKRNPKITYAQLSQQVAKESLTFRLSDFSVGDVASVADQKYSQVFSDIRDGGNVIDIASVTVTYAEETGEAGAVKTETRMDVARPRWSRGPLGPVPDSTVAEMLPAMERESGISALMRYCSYTVTVTFGGRSRTYRAAFYFGPQGQPDPGDMVAALGVLGGWPSL